MNIGWTTALYILLVALIVHLFFSPLTIDPWVASINSRVGDWDNLKHGQRANATTDDTLSSSIVGALTSMSSEVMRFGSDNRYALLLFLLCIPVGINLYGYFFLPLHITKTFDEVEAKLEGKKYRGKRPRRSVGEIPPPYPNSWFKVMNSNELERGEAKDIEMLGQQFVVFRGNDDGKVRILDAYCPHMGAHLGVGGTVEGNEVVCPFHGWQFNGDGKCTKIPYAETLPTLPTSVKSWTILEVNNAIYVWHDAEDREPYWFVPEIKGITDGTWIVHGSATHPVRAHIQEIPENGADTAHLNWLHVPCAIEIPIFDYFVKHTWSATWKAGQGIDSHLAFIELTHGITFRGYNVPGTRIEVHIQQVGPSTVHLTFETLVGKVLVVETVTPVQPLLQRATHQVFAEWKVPRFVAKFILRGLINQFEKDVPIWNNKTFIRAPMIVKQDGPISQYRRWFQKNFYSEHSEEVAQKRMKDISSLVEW